MRFKQLSIVLLLIWVAVSVNGQIPLVYDVENTGASCAEPVLPAPGDLENYPKLPDPFEWSDGSGSVVDFSDWSCRRNEIMAEIEEYEIGPKPVKPESVTATFESIESVLTVEITHNGQTLTLTSNVVIPDGTGPFPVVIGMSSGTGSLPAGLFDGVIQIPFNHDQVVTSSHQGTRDPDAAYFDLYPELEDVGYYSAWSWGISRLIDGIESVQSDLNADLAHIAVTGCSYAGKMALFAGAFDERIALTIAQESGGGGVNSWRVAEALERNVEKIDNTNYSWFMQSLKTNFQGQPGLLPYDHHELMALIVPRALLVLGNPPFEWLGDEAGYVACKGTEKVYQEFGIADRFGFSFRTNHNHCQLPDASLPEVQAFVDKFLHGDETAETTIRYHDDFLEYVNPDSWINWPIDPDAPSVSIDLSEQGTTFEAPVSFDLVATVPVSVNPIAKVTFFNGSEVLGEATTEPFTHALSDLAVGSYTFHAEVEDETGLKGYSNMVEVAVQAPPVQAYKVNAPPVIDGSVDAVWNDVNVLSMNAENVLSGSGFTDQGLSGFAKMMWDDNAVYLLAEITDDILVNDGPNIYDDDNVEFYFDGNNAKATSYDADDAQYSFRWNDAGNIGTIPAGYSTEGVVYEILETANGYNVEAKIPWTTLQVTPVGDMRIGFDFMINDDDDGDGRDSKISWNATEDQAWQNPSYFGTVELKDDIIITFLENINGSVNVSLFPNPAKDVLYLEGLLGEFDCKVFDLNGKMVFSGKSKKNISVNNFKKGIYMLEVYQRDEVYSLKFIKE
jgi:hypothetical protein